MKIRANKLFPYPVLSEFNDSYINNEFLCETTFEYDSEKAYLTFEYKLSDNEILSLLKDTKIGLFFVLDCSETKYRELFPVKLDEDNRYAIEIPLEKLNGMFEIVSLLICKEEIEDYVNENLNALYLDERVVLPKNSIIGYTNTDVFYINKRIDDNGDVPSIFTISCDEESKTMSFDLGDEVITIYLPKNEFDIYTEFKGKRKRLKQLMINFPVLVNLVEILKNDTSYLDKPWYNALDSAVMNKGYPDGILSEKFKNELATKIAQDLLGDIIQDAFKDFDIMEED